jgi:EpsI family protein
VLIGGGMAITAYLAAAAKPRHHEDVIGHDRLANVLNGPVGDWQALPDAAIGIANDTETTEVYDQILTRVYASPTRPPVMLLIAYGAAQSGLMKLHRPDVCYDSSGFRVVDPHNKNLQITKDVAIRTKRFRATRGTRDEQVLYWTRMGDAFPTDFGGQQLSIFGEGLRGLIPDGILVRISTLGPPNAATELALETFARELVTGSSPKGRLLLVGQINASTIARKA